MIQGDLAQFFVSLCLFPWWLPGGTAHLGSLRALFSSLGARLGSMWLPFGLHVAPLVSHLAPFGLHWGTLGAPSGSLWGSIWMTLGCPWPKRSKSQKKVEKVSSRTPQNPSQIAAKTKGFKREAQKAQSKRQRHLQSADLRCLRSPNDFAWKAQLSTKTQNIIENVSILAPIWATFLEPFSQKWPKGSRATPPSAQKTPKWTPRVPKWSPRVLQ